MPNNAPLVYLAINSWLPGLSRYSQTSTTKPVKGITEIRPAREGNFFPILVHSVITNTAIKSFIIKRIENRLLLQKFLLQ